VAALPHTLQHSLPPQTVATEDKDKMESGKKTVVDVDSDEVTGVGVVSAKKGKNWPHMKFLCTTHKEVVAKIFRAVDECKCTTELNANNGDYPKGNNWNRLFDHCFGGGSTGHGLLAGHLSPLATASKLKVKIINIWAYLKEESTKDPVKVDMNLVQTACRQEMEYELSKVKEKAAADKNKHNIEVIQAQMKGYEASLGCLPPGAKGTVGGGRRQHSTNLKTKQPAAYAYANVTTGPEDNAKITPPPSKKAKASSTAINENGLAKLETLGDSFQKSFDKLFGGDKNDKVSIGGNRKQVLYEQQAALEKSILFYQKFPGNEKMQQAMETDMEKYLKVTTEIQALLEDEGN
jgi:hypothetical protein